MAVVHQSEAGWVLDHEAHLNDIYETCIDLTVTHSLRDKLSPCKDIDNEEKKDSNVDTSGSDTTCPTESNRNFNVKCGLFDVYEQFHMDSWFSKKVREEETKATNQDLEKNCGDSNGTAAFNNERGNKRKKRKRPKALSEMDTKQDAYHCHQAALAAKLDLKSKELIGLCREKGYFKKTLPRPCSNNTEARRLAKELETSGAPFSDWCSMSKHFGTDSTSYIDLCSEDYNDGNFPSIINMEMRNTSHSAIVRRLLDETYLIPPRSSFIMSDLSVMSSLLNNETKYDVVVMDPPWQNKSVRRKRKYEEIWVDDILQIPPLLRAGGLLVVWTTNKLVHQRFVTERLFPHWGARHEATWYWVKVTKLGEYVTDMTNTHGKRPYETIFIGRVGSVLKEESNSGPPTQTSDSKTQGLDRSRRDLSPSPAETPAAGGCCAGDGLGPTDLPDQKVIVSVPCSIHSSKPPLSEVLRPYLPDSAQCLELFARSLLPGWTSWGNEAIKFQNIHCFEQIKESKT